MYLVGYGDGVLKRGVGISRFPEKRGEGKPRSPVRYRIRQFVQIGAMVRKKFFKLHPKDFDHFTEAIRKMIFSEMMAQKFDLRIPKIFGHLFMNASVPMNTELFGFGSQQDEDGVSQPRAIHA